MAAASFDADVTRHGGAAGTGALGVHAASRKIAKPAGAGHGPHGHGQPQQERKPVVIYMVSPKVIHVEAHEFLPLVQRLTGPEGGRGDKQKSRPSTSSGGGGAGEESSEGARNKTRAAPPVRVKARALNRTAGDPAVSSMSVTATRQQQQQQAAAAASPSSRLMSHNLSPLRGAALKGELHHPLVSPGWLHHVGDHYLSLGAPLASSTSSGRCPRSSSDHINR